MTKNNSQLPEISPFKKLLFGVLFFFLILLILEFLLSFAGLEKHDSKFMPKSSYPVFVPGKGEFSDYYVTSSHFTSYMNPQAFLKDKQPGMTRIFIVGGSAAFAYPYTEDYGFSGYLRRALSQAFPGKFEIVNAAGMSFGSHRVLDILKDVVKHEPDLVIIYSGNNEYIERNVLPEIKKPSLAVNKLSLLLSRMNLYRAVRLAVFKFSPEVFKQEMQQDITDIRANPDVERGSLGRNAAIDKEVLANYKKNITAMRDLLDSHGVKNIFGTVAVNVSNWIPTVADPQFKSEDDARQWVELFKLKEEAYNRGDDGTELEYLRQMLALVPNDAGMIFNLGKTLWNMQQPEAAYRELVRAKDMDNRPWRALSSFNEAILTVTKEGHFSSLADIEAVFAGQFMKGISSELFLDYCHFTTLGHKIVASELLHHINQVLGKNLPLVQLEGLITEDQHSLKMKGFVRGHELYAKAMTLHNNQRLEQAVATYEEVLIYLPGFTAAYTNIANLYFRMKKVDASLEMYIKAIEADPHNIDALLGAGLINKIRNNLDEAETYLHRAISENPLSPSAFIGLGDIAVKRGDHQKTIEYFTQALELGNDDGLLRRRLGNAYLAQGDKAEALKNWQAALQFNPYDQKTKALVEKYSNE